LYIFFHPDEGEEASLIHDSLHLQSLLPQALPEEADERFPDPVLAVKVGVTDPN
jgi:hypothetical protein